MKTVLDCVGYRLLTVSMIEEILSDDSKVYNIVVSVGYGNSQELQFENMARASNAFVAFSNLIEEAKGK